MTALSLTVTLVLAGLVWTGIARAEPLPPQKQCQADKARALGRLRSCLLKSQANVRGGKPDRSAYCREKFASSLAKIDSDATAAGTSCRFLDHGNGTVGDLDTGLVWEQKVAGSGCTHCAEDTYGWSHDYRADGTAFSDFLNQLNTETSVTGYDVKTPCFASSCDWRLPTIEELNGILLPGQMPSIDPAFGQVQAGRYWSSSTVSGDPSSAWTMDFTQPGTRGTAAKLSFDVHVLAVRGGVL